jgi:hypothetical protein
MAETNEYKLQALWWKRVLSAFTDRNDHQAIPYVLELLRSVGDQRATETAHRAWLLTRRDRADAIAEIRILVAHAEELAGHALVAVLHTDIQLGICEAPGVFGEAKPDTGHHATQAVTHIGR